MLRALLDSFHNYAILVVKEFPVRPSVTVSSAANADADADANASANAAGGSAACGRQDANATRKTDAGGGEGGERLGQSIRGGEGGVELCYSFLDVNLQQRFPSQPSVLHMRPTTSTIRCRSRAGLDAFLLELESRLYCLGVPCLVSSSSFVFSTRRRRPAAATKRRTHDGRG